MEASTAKRRSTSKIEALLFDLGNTLAFLDYELLAREFSRPGLELDALDLERAEYKGRAALDQYLMDPEGPRDADKAYRRYFRAWLSAAGIPHDEVRSCGDRFGAIHSEATLWRVVRPGTFEALERLKSAGLKLAIVTNNDGRGAEDARRFGLAPFFDLIIDSAAVGVAKPDPRIFGIALERLGIAPDEALYTGDIYSIDMIGARGAGIEAKLIDRLESYSWVDHERIRHIGELHTPE